MSEEEMQKMYNAFFENKYLCQKPVSLENDEECYIFEPELIDPETDEPAKLPCRCVGIFGTPQRKYYFMRVEGSHDDRQFNTQTDPLASLPFYKILEDTSPYIFKLYHIYDSPEEAGVTKI